MRYILLSFAALPSLIAQEAATESDWKRLCALETAVDKQYNKPASLSRGVFVKGDVFYWTARETGLTYALDVDTDDTDFEFDLRELQFDWSFGFRAEAGIDFLGDGWDLGLCWTRFYTEAKDKSPYTTGYFIPIWSNPNFSNSLTEVEEAEVKWRLHYTQLDLALGRAFYVSKYFVLRPFIGPSGLWIHQRYKLEYERDSDSDSDSDSDFVGFFPSGKDRPKLKNNFEGYGLNGGCDLRFTFRHGWCIFGKADAGIYSGHFYLKVREKYRDLDGIRHKFISKHSLHIASPTLAAAIGFGYDHSFNHGHNYISARLLWEQLMFFSQNQLFRFVSPSSSQNQSNFVTNQGDLTMQGGTLSIAFGF